MRTSISADGRKEKKSEPDIKLCDWMSRMKQYIHNHKYDLYFFFFALYSP